MDATSRHPSVVPPSWTWAVVPSAPDLRVVRIADCPQICTKGSAGRARREAAVWVKSNSAEVGDGAEGFCTFRVLFLTVICRPKGTAGQGRSVYAADSLEMKTCGPWYQCPMRMHSRSRRVERR